MESRCDVVVVGAGLLGLAAARALTRRGHEVILLEQAEVGHEASGSKGSCRIFRLGYDDADWVAMAMRARAPWSALEEECGRRLLHPAPHLTFGAELDAVRGPVTWSQVGAYEDIRLEVSEDGIAKVTICRPEVRNAFRPQTLIEISDALVIAREDPQIGVIILTGEGPDAFCSGGDQRVWGDTGYLTDPGQPGAVGRFHVTDLQIQIRRLPKPVVAMVAGYAIGGGHVLHLICDLTIAADNARFGQVGPKVGSFDGGYGAGLLAELVGVKKAKEIWFLCFQYGAQEALDMGLVNTVVPLADLEAETVAWSRRMLQMSPFALRLMKASFHAAEDGMAGIQQLAHDANLLFYSTEEAREGREAFKAKRRPEFERFPRRP